MRAKITTKKYRVLDASLNVAECGRGRSLILIHGWSNNWQGWTLLADELAPYFKLYMLDLPGFGDSDRLDSYSIVSTAKYINAFITHQKLQPKAIIGASLGSLIAAYTLKKYPHLSNTLIELGAVLKDQISFHKSSSFLLKSLELADHTAPTQKIVGRTIQSRYTAYLVEKFFSAYKFNKKKLEKYGIPGRKKITGKSYIQLGLSAHKFNLEQYLFTTDKKVLLIYGEAEKYFRLQDAKALIRAIGNDHIRMKVIPRCGHNPAYEQPQVTAQLIIDFLS